MKLKSIHIRGFRVFDDFHFDFPQTPGLYMLTGRNDERPELGSNGVGKSSLWDAVTYALYAQSTRGLRGPELVRDGAAAFELRLEFNSGEIHRQWSKSRKAGLQLADNAATRREISQDELVKVIGLDAEMFLATTIVPQAEPLFADLAPANQIVVLQRLLNLDRWVKYADKAAKAAQPLERAVIAGEADIAAMARVLETTTDVGALRADSAKWKVTHDTRSKELRAQLRAAQAEINERGGVEPRRIALQAAMKSAEARLARLQHNYAVNERKRVEQLTALATLRARHAELCRAADACTERLAFFAENPTCPMCDQVITDTHFETSHAELQAQHDAAAAEAAAVTEQIAHAEQALTALKTRLSDDAHTIRIATDAVSTARQACTTDAQRTADATRRAKDCEAACAQHDAQDNPFTDALVRAAARRKELEAELKIKQDLLADTTALRDNTLLWMRGFKAIRSQLVHDALSQFGMEIAAVCEDLGLVGWAVEPTIDPAVFDTARAASGFRFDVVDPSGATRALKAYSGGELQRAKLAVQLGLGALITDTAVAEPVELEVYDEPSNYMSAEGVAGLLASLRGRAERLGRVIFVVDHHYVHSGDASAVYTLVRDAGRTCLEVV